jgi:hypothetical protein
MQIEDESTYLKIDDDNPDLLKFLETVYPEIEQGNGRVIQHCSPTRPSTSSRMISMCCPRMKAPRRAPKFQTPSNKPKNLFYLNCKGKKVSCIQFQPWITGKYQNHIVAESFV